MKANVLSPLGDLSQGTRAGECPGNWDEDWHIEIPEPRSARNKIEQIG